jgi:hypothetical protein
MTCATLQQSQNRSFKKLNRQNRKEKYKDNGMVYRFLNFLVVDRESEGVHFNNNI